jgi:hypothetical protein
VVPVSARRFANAAVAARLARLLDAHFGEARVLPAGEQVLQVPVALAVADEDECAVHVSSIEWRRPQGRVW